MNNSDLVIQRLKNQHVSEATCESPGEVVEWLCAVQAQDYLGALWAVGLRMRSAVESDIERALADRKIVRTWPMRGTLHFVAAADVRWMLELLTPRIVAGPARRVHEQMGLDEGAFARSAELLARALEGGKQMTRNAIYEVLEAARISTGDSRGLHILSRLAQDGRICFGAREGKQQTFVLLSEWAPAARRLARDEALAELARRYFTSHGPATLQDFTWWSGLTAADAREGLEMAKPRLAQEEIDGRAYWFSPSALNLRRKSKPSTTGEAPVAYLLPAYDEYTVAYKDRSAALSPAHAKLQNSGKGIFNPTIVVDGQVVGVWKRALNKAALAITLSPFAKLKRAEMRAVAEAADRYGRFLGSPVEVSWD
jgi:hypothetical protein